MYFTRAVMLKKVRAVITSLTLMMMVLMVTIIVLNNAIQKTVISIPLHNLIEGIQKNLDNRLRIAIARQ